LILFLVKGNRFERKLFLAVLDDFLEDRTERGLLTKRDSNEIELIRENMERYDRSYLRETISIYAIPFLTSRR
jgi:hypothetical protein